jgi:hypothetical protein
MMRSTSIPAILIMLLITAGCSSSQRAQPTFSVEPNRTKVFLYAAYDNAKDRPYLDATFWIRADSYNEESINVDQYLEIDTLPPGDHVFSVDEIAWTGENLNHSTVTVHIDSAKPSFIAEDIKPDKKVVLSAVDAVRGEKDIMARTHKCACQNSLQRFIKSL